MRCFSGTDSYCEKVIKNIQATLLAGAKHVIILVSGPLDKANSDKKIRAAFSRETVSVLRLEKEFRTARSWSRSLNAGIKFLKESFDLYDDDTLLILSNEVSITPEILKKMQGEIILGAAVVGVRFPGFSSVSYSFPRNTMALWKLLDVIKHGGFSILCDRLGGMEDYWLIRRGHLKYALIEHPDISLGIVPGTNQTAKEKRELRAMKIIDRFQWILIYVEKFLRVFDK
jgi:hypothetical protein